MTVERMREEVIDAYPSSKWKARVERMSDNQVIATYHSLLDKKKIGREKRYYNPDGASNKTCNKTSPDGSRKPCKRLFVGAVRESEGGKQVGFDELLRGVR